MLLKNLFKNISFLSFFSLIFFLNINSMNFEQTKPIDIKKKAECHEFDELAELKHDHYEEEQEETIMHRIFPMPAKKTNFSKRELREYYTVCFSLPSYEIDKLMDNASISLASYEIDELDELMDDASTRNNNQTPLNIDAQEVKVTNAYDANLEHAKSVDAAYLNDTNKRNMLRRIKLSEQKKQIGESYNSSFLS